MPILAEYIFLLKKSEKLKFMCVNFRILTSNKYKANLPFIFKEGIKWETMQIATAVSLMVMIMD